MPTKNQKKKKIDAHLDEEGKPRLDHPRERTAARKGQIDQERREQGGGGGGRGGGGGKKNRPVNKGR